MGRILAIGDIHGNYKGFLQALKRCNFDYENDTLISLGDVVDGHGQSFQVVDKLIHMKNTIFIKGNHDDWFHQWIVTGINPADWRQGQKATGISYLENHDFNAAWFTLQDTPGGGKEYKETLRPIHVPLEHRNFFKNQLPYYIDDKNRLFIHGGFNRHFHLDDQDESMFWWDRDLWSQALSWQSMVGMSKPVQIRCTCSCHTNPGEVHMMACCDNGFIKEDKNWKPKFKMVGDFEEVFIGHTSTQFWKEDKPMHAANIWNLDTGGGWFGYITIMDVNTKEFWQSDKAIDLYPEFKGR